MNVHCNKYPYRSLPLVIGVPKVPLKPASQAVLGHSSVYGGKGPRGTTGHRLLALRGELRARELLTRSRSRRANRSARGLGTWCCSYSDGGHRVRDAARGYRQQKWLRRMVI